MPRMTVHAALNSLSLAPRTIRHLVGVVVGFVALALVVTIAPAPQLAAAEDPITPSPVKPSPTEQEAAGDWVQPTGEGLSRPDFVSASVTARSAGQRVEVLSERSQTSRSWVLPSGLVEVEETGPARFEDPSATDTDGWRDIDLTLKQGADGSLRPASTPGETLLSGGGASSDLATVTDAAGQSVTLGSGLEGLTLPKPTVNGSVATYADVIPGVDIRVELRPSGLQQVWVIKSRAGLTALATAKASGGLVTLGSRLGLKKLTVALDAGGAVVFSNSKGKKVGQLQPPTMWDAAIDPRSGDHTAVKPVTFQLTGTTAKSLRVKADLGWLSDPARVFPITIDPTYTTTSSSLQFDTFVQEGYTTDQSGADEIKLGNNGSGQVARSYLVFNSTNVVGRKIMSGTLSLYETHSWSCSARAWAAYNAGVATTSTRWTNQPTIGAQYATSTQTKGYSSSSCPNGTVTIDMKDQLQYWSDQGLTSKGVMLRATSETDATYWKRFSSSEGGNPPKLTYTYNKVPATMATPSVANTVSYTPSGSSTSYLYTSSKRPNVSGVVSDPDGNTVRGKFYTMSTQAAGGVQLAYCTNGALVASGSTTSCTMDADLPADTTVWIKSRAIDSNAEHGSYSGTREIRVATNTPTAPTISCPGYTSGSWLTTAPASGVSCDIVATGSGYSAPSTIRWSIDGRAKTDSAIPQSTSSAIAKKTVTVTGSDGGHTVQAWAISPSGLISTPTTFNLGWGEAALQTPRSSPRLTTTGTVPVSAAGPPQGAGAAPTASVQWRVSGNSTATGWTDSGPLAVSQVSGQTRADGSIDVGSLGGQTDSSGVTVNQRVPTLIDIRACLAYPAGTQCTGQSTVMRVPHAFGAGFPVADAGPGQVALWTGELSLDDSDAELSTPDGSLSVSRSHTSYAGLPAPQNRVFGPGWIASFDGDGSGAGGAEIVDSTTIDGTLAVVDADGEALIYLPPATTTRRTTSTLPTGLWRPADEETASVGGTLTITGSGTSTTAELKTDDGIITKYQVTAAPTTAPSLFRTVEVREPAIPGKTSYSYDAQGRITAITGALPDGVSTCVPGTPSNGCRALKITYAAATTATTSAPGDFIGQITQVVAQVNTDADRVLATYQYDTSGRLVLARDARTNLTTAYSWTTITGQQRLATMTPPGLAPYTFDYASDGKLWRVTRPNPDSAGGGIAQLGAYVYNIQPFTTITDLPNLAATVALWNQASTPTTGFAVFGQDKPINAAPTAGSPDWLFADLQFTDANGYTVNTANYGAGDWQLTAADFDTNDNIIHAWDERATSLIRAADAAGEASNGLQYATITVYNDDISSGGQVVTPAGTLVTDTYSPVHQVAPVGGSAADGLQPLRTHTRVSYDQGAPNSGINPLTGQPYRLPTTTVRTAETVEGVVDSTLSTVFSGYDPIVTGDVSGWALGQAITTTTDLDSSGTITADDITNRTRYDDRGRTIEDRQPKSDGTDAGTQISVYYTAGTSTVSSCGNKPALAGYLCRVGPAAQPAGQTLPVTTTTSYTWDGQVATTTDTSGSVTSTNTTSYDAADRPTTSTTTVTGLSSSTAVPAVTTSYDTATGLSTGTNSTSGSTTTSYDSWGRRVTYINTPAGQPADSATTTYDPAGRVASVVDGNGSTNYTYDNVDANGRAERRGLLTSIKVKVTGGVDYESTGSYDQSGDLEAERLPGQIIRRTNHDVTGELVGLSYNGVADDGTGAIVPDQPWFSWTTWSNADEQVVREWTPTSFTSDTGADSVFSDRSYTYDRAGRLTKVQDRTGVPAAGQTSVPCTTRTYTFDANGNRIGQGSYPADSAGDCTASGGNFTSRAFDSADRPITGANSTGSYVYDPLGRQTSLPASDAPNGEFGNVALGYYDTDAIRTITQNNTTTTFSLDGANRRLSQTTTNGGTTTSNLVRHYTDDSDNPSWSVDTTGATNTTTRYTALMNGDLGLTFSTSGAVTTAQLALPAPRGDTATTINLGPGATGPTGAAAAGIDTWTDYIEYGQRQQPVSTAPGGVTGIGYGWKGTKERATLSNVGLTLLGSRLYNPATGLFTSSDPVAGGSATAYAYPVDPINHEDLDGNWWRKVGRFASKHRGLIATGIATAACIVPAVGWAACAGLQALAWGVRTQQHASTHGGYRRNWRRYAKDGAITAASFGIGRGAGYAIKYGRMGRPFKNSYRRGKSRYGLTYTRRYSRMTGVARRGYGRYAFRGTARHWAFSGAYGGSSGAASYYARRRYLR